MYLMGPRIVTKNDTARVPPATHQLNRNAAADGDGPKLSISDAPPFMPVPEGRISGLPMPAAMVPMRPPPWTGVTCQVAVVLATPRGLEPRTC